MLYIIDSTEIEAVKDIQIIQFDVIKSQKILMRLFKGFKLIRLIKGCLYL